MIASTSPWYFYPYLFAWAALSLFSLHRLFLVFLYFRHRNDVVEPRYFFEELPRITIQLPVYNEKEVIGRLLDSVAAIRYPRELLDIQLLDDSTDECKTIAAQKIEKLALSGLPICHIQREDRVGFKAGALQNGMKTARGEFIFILDADFIPPPDVLLRSVHYFSDPKIGCVQMRWDHVNRNFSLLTRVQAIFLDGHFAIEQFARNRSGRFFNFNGTAGIWRKKSIEEAGGWEGDTLTEDLDLSYRAQLAGWRFLFLTDITVPAELPIHINAFKTQQHRWIKGSLQTARKLLGKIWGSPIPLKTKIEASFHLTMNCSYPFLLLLLILLPFVIPRPFELPLFFFTIREGFFHGFIFSLAVVSVSIFYLSSQIAAGQGFIRPLKDLPFLLALGLGMCLNNTKAVLEGLFGKSGEFKRTPKRNVDGSDRSKHWNITLPSLPPLACMEMAAGCYFLFLIGFSVIWGKTGVLPFLALFCFGFAYIGFYSWVRMER